MKIKIPFITKYYNGSYIGGLLDTYARASIVIGSMQFLIVVVILYTTSIQPNLARFAPWMTFAHYIIIALLLMLGLMVFSRLLITPSAYTYSNRQVWGNNNPMRAKLEQMERNQKKIMEKLGIDDVEEISSEHK